MRGQMLNSSKLLFPPISCSFSTPINRSEIQVSPACSRLNSEQNDVLFWYLEQVFVTSSIQKGNNIALNGRKRPKANWVSGLAKKDGNGQKVPQTGLCGK